MSYVQLTQADFAPSYSGGKLTDSLTLFNLPYATAVSTVGSESNLLRAGVRGALGKMRFVLPTYLPIESNSSFKPPLLPPLNHLPTYRKALLSEFLPMMKEASTVYAVTQVIKMMQETLAKVSRWVGG